VLQRSPNISLSAAVTAATLLLAGLTLVSTDSGIIGLVAGLVTPGVAADINISGAICCTLIITPVNSQISGKNGSFACLLCLFQAAGS